MKQGTFIILFLTIFIYGNSSAQGLKTDFKKVIKQSFCYTDLNPNNKPESDKIQTSFTKALNEFGDKDYSKAYTESIDSLFRYLFKNSSCEYDDSPDIRRMKMRRAFCYATIALKTGHSRAFTFIENSKLSIVESIENPDIELLENQYLGILLVETMLKFEFELINENDIVRIEKYLNENLELLDEQIFFETNELMKKCRKHFER